MIHILLEYISILPQRIIRGFNPKTYISTGYQLLKSKREHNWSSADHNLSKFWYKLCNINNQAPSKGYYILLFKLNLTPPPPP